MWVSRNSTEGLVSYDCVSWHQNSSNYLQYNIITDHARFPISGSEDQQKIYGVFLTGRADKLLIMTFINNKSFTVYFTNSIVLLNHIFRPLPNIELSWTFANLRICDENAWSTHKNLFNDYRCNVFIVLFEIKYPYYFILKSNNIS